MLNKVFDFEESMRVIEENLPQMPTHCNNDFSKAICNLLLHLARKEITRWPIQQEIKAVTVNRVKARPTIPIHFLPVLVFCKKWGWAINTIRNLLKDHKYPAYRQPSVCIHNPLASGKNKWFVDEKRLLKTILQFGETPTTRNHASRNLDMIKQMEKIEKQKQKLKEKEDKENENRTL